MENNVIDNIYKNQVPSYELNKKYFKKQGKKTVCIGVQDIRNMIFWLTTSNANKPIWISFSNIPILQTVVVVVIDSTKPFYKNYKDTYFSIIPLKRPMHNLSWSNQLLYTYKSSVKRRVDEIEEVNNKTEENRIDTKNVNDLKEKLCNYLLDENELLINNYIVYADDEFKSFVDTNNLSYNTNAYPIVALDCEMVVTNAGYELARVTCVDQNEVLLLDSFAMPDLPVNDYVTKYSGITPELLKGAPSFKEVQEKVLSLINKDSILIGHSLENDLRALKIIHHKCVDSAVLFSYVYGSKNKLSHLTSKLLHYSIQNHVEGHDSGEDAIASLRLVLYRMNHNKINGNTNNTINLVPTASLLDVVSKNNKRVIYMDSTQQTSFHSRKANMVDMINITKGKETICKSFLSLSRAKKIPGLIYIRRPNDPNPFEEMNNDNQNENEHENDDSSSINQKDDETDTINPNDLRNVNEISELLTIFKQNYKNSLFVIVEKVECSSRFGNMYLYMNTKIEDANIPKVSEISERIMSDININSPVDLSSCTLLNPESIDIE